MKKTTSFLMIILVATMATTIFNSCDKNQQPQTTEIAVPEANLLNMDDLINANNRLYDGLNAMFAGNVEPLNNLWSRSDSITYMGPFGGRLKGWSDVNEEFTNVAAMKLGGKISCNDVYAFVGTNLGYVSCVEEGENMGPDGKPVSVSHRATNIFHIENGTWRLVHHHTDISSQLEEVFDKEID